MDLLVVSIPVLDLQYPPSSPAIIKACAQAAGFTSQTLDLNLELRRLCNSSLHMSQIQHNFENIQPQITDTQDPVHAFFFDDHDLIRTWINHCVELVAKKNPRWLGISVFSYKSHKAALLLCIEIKKHLPDIKIVVGGRGSAAYLLGPDHMQFVDKMKKFFGNYPYKNFGDTLYHYKLADAVIQGDGENAIVELLSGSTTAPKEVDLLTIPFVNFDDYCLSEYEYVNDPILPITGSKGCVRKCTFCDIPVLWPNFKFRSGEHIAKEMIHLYQQHGVRKFYMSDSLVNGSLTAFKDFITILAKHNRENPENTIKWVGQYITRNRSRALDDEYYDLLKDSGGEGLTIGAESGSDAVRAHMKKQFQTVDIDHEIAEFDKRGIVCVLLFFSSYPTETWDDFCDTVDMFIRYQKYCANGTIYKITLGTPYTHHPQTPLWNMQESIGLQVAKGSDILWRLGSNPELTYYERIRRRLILQEVATVLHLPMSRNTPELNQMIDSLRLHGHAIKNYFGACQVPIFDDKYNLFSQGSILMPPSIQKLVQDHLYQHKKLVTKISQIHTNINDDILFDNKKYIELKQLLIDQST